MNEKQAERLIETIQNLHVTLWFIQIAVCALAGIVLAK